MSGTVVLTSGISEVLNDIFFKSESRIFIFQKLLFMLKKRKQCYKIYLLFWGIYLNLGNTHIIRDVEKDVH